MTVDGNHLRQSQTSGAVRAREDRPKKLGLNLTAAQIQQLIDGELAIDELIARKLAEILGSTEEFWLKSEQLYRSRLAKLLPFRSKTIDL